MLVRYRVDELAARAGVSVDTVRFYQGKGLLGAPEREGRIAWYSDAHLEALRRVRDLKNKGFSLASIRRLVGGDLDPADEALVTALAEQSPGPAAGTEAEWLSLDELARRTGVTPALLEAIGREGLLSPRLREGAPMYRAGDEEAVAAGLRLLEAGLPLSELLALARALDAAMREIARRAVDLFDEYVRHPLLEQDPAPEAGRRLVAAFENTFPATTTLVAHHFARLLLDAAMARVEGLDETDDPPAGSSSVGLA
jgi:DNA-binding transcriptional MerR regulator